MIPKEDLLLMRIYVNHNVSFLALWRLSHAFRNLGRVIYRQIFKPFLDRIEKALK